MKDVTVLDLNGAIPDVAEGSITSRTLLADAWQRIVLFGVAADQELTEHRSPLAATIHVIAGQMDVHVGEENGDAETIAAGPGTLIAMAPNTPHSLRAHTETRFLLTMTKGSS